MIEALWEAMDAARVAFDSIMVAGSDMTEEDLLAVVGLSARVSNVALGVQAVAVARFASRDHVKVVDPASGAWDGRWARVDRGPGHVADYADCSVGTALGFSTAKASALTHHSAKIAADLPETLAAMGHGSLDPWRAHAVAAELRDSDPGVCAEVEARVFPAVLGETAGAARGRVRRAVAMVDPDAATRRATKARADRDVQTSPAEFAMTDWWMRLPAGDSMFVKAAMDARAHELRGQDTSLTAGQARADAIVDLVLSNATITATVALTIPVQTVTTPTPDARHKDGGCAGSADEHRAAQGAAAQGAAPESLAENPAPEDAAEGAAPDGPALTGPASEALPSANAASEEASGGEAWTTEPNTDGAGAGDAGAGDITAGDMGAGDMEAGDMEAGDMGTKQAWAGNAGGATESRQRRRSADSVLTTLDPATGEVTTLARRRPRTPDYDPHDPRTADDRHRDATCPPQGSTATGSRVPAGWVIPGVGIIDGPVVAAILDTFSTRITAVLLDDQTGTAIGTTTKTYVPSKAMADLVRRRDGTCRFPSCTRTAARCDIDHITPWPTGTTTAANLATLCRHHHRAKTHDDWTYIMDSDGTCTWTSPHGEHYLTQATNHHHLVS